MPYAIEAIAETQSLRKCRGCGREITHDSELELFIKSKNCAYGRDNLCKECANERNKKWSDKNRLYHRYRYMIHRCYHPNATGYKNYGGRGITVCEEWLENPQAFFDWARYHGFKPELELDRIDNDENYSPDNCRWITHRQQAFNRRTNTTDWIRKTRICPHCKRELSLIDFPRNKANRTGFMHICKECHRRERNRRYRKQRNAITVQEDRSER